MTCQSRYSRIVSKTFVLILVLGLSTTACAQIPKPTDAPKPLTPAESAKLFKVPKGFRIELVASEPLIREPSGVCWDERGRLFVCELHGYNLEGQYDIEELNKSGKLDRVVRRIQANGKAKEAAEKHTYGTIKLLHDTDGDGRMDKAVVWADRLPPCHGICPARGGIIAACRTQILFLADRDGDGNAEVRDVLFEGFGKSILERSINCPQLGPDNWIYVGNGSGGGTITGKYLKKPIRLPRSDFRIKSDGTAIEPVVGSTGTMGFAFTESGDRFVVSTRAPGVFVAPLPWNYLTRNPFAATPSLEISATSDQRVYPTSQPHPWRTRRANDPGFSKYYRDRYGIQESAPNGFFTSACAPLVYQDVALPLRGQLLACEPAQNLVHRAIIKRDGARLTLHRAPGEEKAEFLTSSDPWFHAISLAHAPDGSVFITDFYREIIEDYSAVPRYLQQIYGLINGKDHGRIWRLTHENAKVAPHSDMSRLKPAALAKEVGSPHYWRRTTARRLLVERRSKNVAPQLARLARSIKNASSVLNAMHALDGLDALTSKDILAALAHAAPEVRRQGLRFADRRLNEPKIQKKVLALSQDKQPIVRLQVALTLGESDDPQALKTLLTLAKNYGDERWLVNAILSSAANRSGALLGKLLADPKNLGKAHPMLEPLCAVIAARRNPKELSHALIRIATTDLPYLQNLCLRGLRARIKGSASVALTDDARSTLKKWKSIDGEVQAHVRALVSALKVESLAERRKRLGQAVKDLTNIRLPAKSRLAAAHALAAEDDASLTLPMLKALKMSTPGVREVLMNGVMSRRSRFGAVLDALQSKALSPAELSALHRNTLRKDRDPAIRSRAEAVFSKIAGVNEKLFPLYMKALKNKRDAANGKKAFQKTCAACHRVHGIGQSVGPDLSAEYRRAEEVIIKDILAPNDAISPGYQTYSAVTNDGRVFAGVLAAEAPTSVTLRQADGKQEVILRKDIDEFYASAVSMMPEDLYKNLSPRDAADIIAWLRRPPARLTLLDDNREIALALKDGKGTVAFIFSDKHSGSASLRVTPPQRHSSRIKGWDFRIREKPRPGEFRYIRFAWKTTAAHGIMLELAADGRWPPAKKPMRRYHAGKNTTGWHSVEVANKPPTKWTVVTRDLWKDFGDFTLTGIAPTAMGGAALFDRIELLQSPGTGR